MANPSLTVTHTSTVTDDQIDALGHMNVRWYGDNALRADAEMTRRLGLDAPGVVSAYTRHHHEQLLGARLEVSSGVVGGTQRLRLYHELRNATSGELAATFVHELDHASVETPPIEIPEHGRPRSIDIDAEPHRSAPTLQEAIASELAVRCEREIDRDDTDGGTAVPMRNGPGLFWAGEPADGNTDWIRTGPDGHEIANATMESRVLIDRLPALGTRIQSFGAPVAVAEKVSRHVYWAFELDTGELLGVMETVSIVIDLGARRAIPIPPAERELLERRLRPDLAPR